MTRKILYAAFLGVWGIGLALTVGVAVWFFGVHNGTDLPTRIRLSLSPSNATYHPSVYDPLFADLTAFLGDDPALSPHVVLVLPPMPDEAQGDTPPRVRDLITFWLYPRTVDLCRVDSPEQAASQCATPSEDTVLVGYGFEAIPGLDCESDGTRLFVCR